MTKKNAEQYLQDWVSHWSFNELLGVNEPRPPAIHAAFWGNHFGGRLSQTEEKEGTGYFAFPANSVEKMLEPHPGDKDLKPITFEDWDEDKD